MKTQAQHDGLTLQEYLQTYNIRKKIQQRKKSKQKNQSPFILSEQQAKMKGIFTFIDQFNEQTKIELEDLLLNSQDNSDRIFFFLAKTLDELIRKIKEHITKMYEDVYRFIKVQSSQSSQHKPKEDVADYLKNKITVAKEEKKKANMAQVVKENFKNQDKNTLFAKLIMGKTIINNNTESNQSKLKQAASASKQPTKAAMDSIKSVERNKKDQAIKKVQQKPLLSQHAKNPQVQGTKNYKPTINQKKQALPPLPPMLEEPPQQPRLNSFMQALFGAIQNKSNQETTDKNPPIETQKDDIKKKQIQKQSRISTNKQFQRKRSVKEMLKSPKAQILLNRSPYH